MNKDEDRIESELIALIQFGQVPTESLTDSVTQLGFKKRIDAVINGDYNKASIYDNALAKLSKLQSEYFIKNDIDILKKKKETRMKNLKERICIVKELYHNKIKDLEGEYIKRRRSLLERQDKDIDRFNLIWNSPEYLCRFSKPSYNLQQLRFIEKKQAIFKEYSNARQTKLKADKMQKMEEDIAQKQIERKMKSDYEKLISKHDDEQLQLETYYKKMAQNIRIQLQCELDIIDKTLSNLDKQDVSINKRIHGFKPSLMGNENSSPASNIDETEYYYLSPRTAAKLNDFRDNKVYELNIKPLSEGKIDEILKDL